MDKSYACILIADATLQDLPVLLADLPASVHLRLVHSASEALGEFWQALASAGLTQLHWLSHGMPGGVVIAGQALTAADFCQRFDGAAERDLDVAFWSCHTGAGEPGRAFVEALTRATGAQVAASAVEVGAGFWQLSPAVNAPFSARAQLEFAHTLPAPAQFASSVTYQASQEVGGLALGDLNGDGTLDIQTAGTSNNASTLLNNGTGSFTHDVNDNGQPGGEWGCELADLNGDGHLDLVSRIYNAVVVNRGSAQNGFTNQQYYLQNETVHDAIAAQVNNDGRFDLLVSRTIQGQQTLSVLLGQSDGTLAAPVNYALASEGEANQLHATDLNNDGKQDVIALSFGNTISVLMNNGDGTFANSVSYQEGDYQNQLFNLTSADVNGDGYQDVIAVDLFAGSVSVKLNQGNGLLGPASHYATGTAPTDIVAVDLNGDGAVDLATANTSSVSVLLGNGDGSFAAKQDIQLDTQQNHIRAGDLNQDGKQDLVVASYSGNSVSVLLNTTGSVDSIAPVVSRLEVAGTSLIVHYTEITQLDAAHPPALSQFAAKINNSPVALTGAPVVDAVHHTVTLTLNTPVALGQTVTLSYTDASTNDDIQAVQDVAGNDAASFTLTTAPMAAIQFSADTGVSHSDFITFEPTQTLSGHLLAPTVAGQTIQVSVNDGTSWTTASNTIGQTYWSLEQTLELGQHALKVRLHSASSNTELVSQNYELTWTGRITPESSSVNGNTITVWFMSELPLDASHPPALDAFTVTVNGVAAALSGVAVINGNARTLTLTLANPVLAGQTVMLHYSDPMPDNGISNLDADAALQDIGGSDALSWDMYPNNYTPVNDTTPPVFSSASVNGATLTLSYTDASALNSQGPLLSAFSVKVAGSAVALSGAAPVVNTTAKTLTLTLASPVQNGQAVTVSYTDPSSGNDSAAIQDIYGNDAASLTAAVVNNLTPIDSTPPVLTSATVNGDQVLLRYTDSNPLKSSMGGLYVIKVDGVVAQTHGATANPSNNTILITLANAVLAGQVVTFSYTDPTSGNDLLAIQDVAGNDAASVVDFSVSNLTVPTYQMAAGETSYTVTATQYNVMGNALDNLMTGDSKPNNLMGGAGNDTLLGGGNNGDRLYGEAGNDVLNSGLGGSHRLVGGSGDDRYEIAYLATVLVEQPDEGNDSVYVMPGANLVVPLITLSANIENMIAKNSESFNVIGNASDNYLLGNQASGLLKGLAGNDTLISQGGDDTLEGGDGDDVIAPVAHSHMTENTRVLTGNMQLSGGNGADIFVMAEGFVGDHKDGWNPDEFSGNYYSPSQPVGIQGVYISDFERGVDKISLTLSEAALVPTTVNTLTLTAGMTLASAVDQAASRGSAAAPQVTIILNENVGCAYLVLDQSDASTFSSNDLAIKLNYSMPLGIGDLMFTKLSQQNQLLPAESAPPVFTQASVNGNQLVLSYSDASPLDSVAPPLGAFAVTVNGNAASVSAASVNSLARTLTLTLASPVQNGQVVTVSYTDPSSGNDSVAIQDRYGNDAASLAATPVNNLTTPADVTPPVLQSASLTDSTLVLTYSDTSPLDAAHPPALSAFNVKVAGVTVSLTGAPVVNATARTLTLTLADPVLAGQAVTVSYTDPSSSNDAQAVQDGSGNDAQTVLNRVVSNLGTNTSYVMDATTVNYTATGTAALTIQGNALNNQITGNAADNLIRGGQGNDRLLGGLGNDQLLGEEGGDSLDGGAGSDTLSGGAGNDAYYVDSVDDQIIEQANDGIADTVYALINYTLGNDLEHLVLMGQATQGQGNALANALTGNALANTLTGLAGDDRIDGKQGADTMLGGTGNDSYYVDQAGDSVIELANEGADTVYAYLDYTLGANQEGLNLLGNLAVVGQGNELGNMLNGNALENTLMGMAGNDSLDGKQGADTLIGGLGNDTYYVDHAADVVTEQANEGVDTVYASVSHTLADNVETLRMTADGQTAMGNAANNVIYGSAGQDVLIDGGAGNDIIYTLGDKGGDQYVHGGLGNDLLYVGGTLANGDRGSYVYGDAGDDTLNATHGDVKSDLMGGAGNDTYVINNIHNRVIENVNDGYDTVQTSVSFSLQAGEMFIPDSVDVPVTTGNVERLLMTGTANIDGFGNELVNYLLGNAGNNVLLGRDGADTLVGQGGNDLLDGGNGNDTLAPVTHASSLGTPNVHTGQITLTGGNGSDVFWMTQGYVGDHSSGGNTLTLSDFVHGQDKVKFTLSLSATLPTTLTTLTPSGGATLASLLNQAAVAGSASAPKVTAFAFAGDTYLVLDQTSASSFTSDDLAIKLSGTPAFTFSDLAFVKM